jgi:DNA-directed RNA polymerase specialized sigma24 family protein
MRLPATAGTVPRVDLDDARAALPEVYAEALRLRDQGLDRAEIGVRLSVPVSAMTSLLWLASAKLSELLAGPSEQV